MKGTVRSAFSLIIDDEISEHIRTCTELEASKILEKKWSLTQIKLKAFIVILYARETYEAKNLKSLYLWNKQFFPLTMSRNNFMEILHFIQFDKKNERSQRL
ncbi:hypothetical protein APICC_01960 [Apis cerana cerana]|uniref:PiggyBac transposable element-derived protein domain-containing protein n=1 Tax=Apis cerana cerana TaxID=94128 RepID=A0A2A3E054_APICC|nr:hypothetical protein APICC_01960 [Apis cerana cerana]